MRGVPFTFALLLVCAVRVAAGELTTRFKLTFVDGDAATRALRVAGGFSITDLALHAPDGTLDLAARFEVAQRDPDTATVALSEGESTVRRLSVLLPGEREPLWSVPEAVASGIAVDLDRRSLEIGQLTAWKASARLRREADGTFDWARLLRTDATTGSGSGEPTWQFTIRRAGLERATLEIEDRGPKPPVRLRLSELDVRGENYSNGRDTKGTLAVAGRLGTGGRVAATGPFGTNPLTGRLRMDATGVALVPFQPYLVPRVNATVTSGTVAASGTFAFDVADGGEMRASYAGDIVVSDFASLDPPTASDLVEWKTLRLAQVDAVLAPLRLGIGAVRLDGFFARVIVYADGTLNLTRLFWPTPAAARRLRRRPAGSAGDDRPRRARQRQRRYSDYYIKPNYSANLTGRGDRLSDVSAAGPRTSRSPPASITAPVESQARQSVRDGDRSRPHRQGPRHRAPPLSPYSASRRLRLERQDLLRRPLQGRAAGCRENR
jgi:hypothetical protein